MHHLQQLFGACGGGGFLLPVRLGAEDGLRHVVGQFFQHSSFDVFDHRHFFEQADILEGSSNACMNDLVGLFAVHPLTIQVKGAFGRLIHTSDQVEHGGFACAVGADQPHQLGFADFHIKIIHGFQAAKLDAKVLAFQNGLCHGFYRAAAGQFFQRTGQAELPPAKDAAGTEQHDQHQNHRVGQHAVGRKFTHQFR